MILVSYILHLTWKCAFLLAQPDASLGSPGCTVFLNSYSYNWGKVKKV